MKLWLLDQQMNKKKDAMKTEEENSAIPGNETDEKMNNYYSTFIKVAKSF